MGRAMGHTFKAVWELFSLGDGALLALYSATRLKDDVKVSRADPSRMVLPSSSTLLSFAAPHAASHLAAICLLIYQLFELTSSFVVCKESIMKHS